MKVKCAEFRLKPTEEVCRRLTVPAVFTGMGEEGEGGRETERKPTF